MDLVTNITNINELPSFLLGEIISRLACYKLICQCKCVSKHWRAFISEPCFIRAFLLLQIEKQPSKPATLIDLRGEELHSSMSPSMRLTELFKRLASFYGLWSVPIVVNTYNDLVLCCSAHENHVKYFICNPYTMQWLALPLPPTQFPLSAKVVGLICDAPYYNCVKGNNGNMTIQLNSDYKFRVVRMFRSDHHPTSLLDETKVEIFSSETGQWSESVVIAPESWYFVYNSIAHNGVLYHLCQLNHKTCLAGLDPFMITKTIKNISTSTSSNDPDCYKCCLVEIDTNVAEGFDKDHCVISESSLRISYFNWDSLDCFNVYIWDLKEDEDGKMCYKHTGVYSLDRDMAPVESLVTVCELVAIDPNDNDVVYIDVNGDLVMCNIETREWSVLVPQSQTIGSNFCKLELPLWPTPIPRIG